MVCQNNEPAKKIHEKTMTPIKNKRKIGKEPMEHEKYKKNSMTSTNGLKKDIKAQSSFFVFTVARQAQFKDSTI